MLLTLVATSVAQGFDGSAKQIEDLKSNLNAPVDVTNSQISAIRARPVRPTRA